MATPDDITAYEQRLGIYRRSLRHELQRVALLGGEQHTPVDLFNSVVELRASIRQLKGALRAAGVAVADSFDDERPADGSVTMLMLQSQEREPEASPADGPTAIDVPYASCFISYSHQDEVFAYHLARSLRMAGLNAWIASDDMRGGNKLYEQVRAAIRRQDKLLLVLSASSIASEWVTSEIRLARRAEIATGQRKLFPIRLVDMPTLREWEVFDADVGKDLAVEVREYFIPDFSQWERIGVFEVAFARLIRDLRVVEG